MMMTPPFESLDALWLFLSQSSHEKFQKSLPSFSFNALVDSLTLLQTQPILEAKSKLNSFFEFISSTTNLELLAKHFSPSSFINFLDFLNQNSHNYHNRLDCILIGLDPLVFSQSLHFLQDSHLHILRRESLFESLQYQLTQFAHEGETLKQNTEQQLERFQQEVLSIKGEELNQSQLQALIDHVDDLRNQLINYLERASTALAIAWHTNRMDLIEKLSSVNDTIQHQLNHLIGHSAFDQFPSTGIYAFLEHTFSNIFDLSSLKDNDAAIEGMTRLSIWHLKDYWELGLFPFIQHPEELDLDSENSDEKTRWDHQQRLFSLVQQQLESLGIEKIKDLKKLHLFSKSLLKTYIEQHHHLLCKEPL